MGPEHRKRRALEALALSGTGAESVADDADGALPVCLEKTLQCEDLDLAILTLKGLLDFGLPADQNEQCLRVIAPARVWKSVEQSDQRDLGFVFTILLLHRVSIPVERGIEVLVFRITRYEVIEFFGGTLPVLRFDKVAAFAKDLH